MNNLEDMCIMALNASMECTYYPNSGKSVSYLNYNLAAKKSAEITEQIAIEFAEYCIREMFNENAQDLTPKELFQEFLKTKA